MICLYILILLLRGFAALTVPLEKCERDVLEGSSCILKMTTKDNKRPPEVKWVHDSGKLIHWKNQKIRTNTLEASLEDDGSLRLDKVSVNYTGTYIYTAFNNDGTQSGSGNVEIRVYVKVSKPTVKIECNKGNATLTCETGDTNVTITWYKGKDIMQNEKKRILVLTPSQIKENKQYMCDAGNPANTKQSDPSPEPCSDIIKIFGIQFDMVMLSILASGLGLLLLLICVLIICACRSCRRRYKIQEEEAELRLNTFQDSEFSGTNRSKQTARGQPAPPIPQEEPINGSPSPQTTPRIQPQPKAQTRARPPPPPQDEDDEDPPPLPRPRNKQRNKRNQEPYRPME